jgi:hypothetical protein
MELDEASTAAAARIVQTLDPSGGAMIAQCDLNDEGSTAKVSLSCCPGVSNLVLGLFFLEVVLAGRTCRWAGQSQTACITQTNRVHLVPFGMQSRTFGPCWQPIIGCYLQLGWCLALGWPDSRLPSERTLAEHFYLYSSLSLCAAAGQACKRRQHALLRGLSPNISRFLECAVAGAAPGGCAAESLWRQHCVATRAVPEPGCNGVPQHPNGC